MDVTSTQTLFGVEGMVVVITGGATGIVKASRLSFFIRMLTYRAGIGLMMTKAFAANGAKVYIVGRRKEKLDEAAKLAPERIIPLVGDVTSKHSLHQVAGQVEKDAGFVNLLVCNSGTMAPVLKVSSDEVSVKEYAKAAMDLNMDDWNQQFSANITGLMYVESEQA